MAKKTVCGSRQHSTGLAFEMWSGDHNGLIFPADIEKVSSDTEGDWFDDLRKYIGRGTQKELLEDPAELWLCPCDKDPYPIGIGSSPHFTGITSYMLNGCYREKTVGEQQIKWNLGPAGGYKHSQIRTPSEVMFLLETSLAECVIDAEHPAAQALGATAALNYHHRKTSGFYHLDGMNLLYVDGHVGFKKGLECRPLPPLLVPDQVRLHGYMFWDSLRLPDASEQPHLWGPGY